jgi:hypothetical protein
LHVHYHTNKDYLNAEDEQGNRSGVDNSTRQLTTVGKNSEQKNTTMLFKGAEYAKSQGKGTVQKKKKKKKAA